mmetsp:Transcript_6733/g.17233  ORF Transcript_6733/g.17233 Transcript_6733/m.17233 type:complete len:242 (+) Transcript_6733:363-1088(+)
MAMSSRLSASPAALAWPVRWTTTPARATRLRGPARPGRGRDAARGASARAASPRRGTAGAPSTFKWGGPSSLGPTGAPRAPRPFLRGTWTSGGCGTGTGRPPTLWTTCSASSAPSSTTPTATPQTPRSSSCRTPLRPRPRRRAGSRRCLRSTTLTSRRRTPTCAAWAGSRGAPSRDTARPSPRRRTPGSRRGCRAVRGSRCTGPSRTTWSPRPRTTRGSSSTRRRQTRPGLRSTRRQRGGP